MEDRSVTNWILDPRLMFCPGMCMCSCADSNTGEAYKIWIICTIISGCTVFV